MGESIVCLQEIPRWTNGRSIKGRRFIIFSNWSKADETASWDGFHCGFLFPQGLNPRVRDMQIGQYWAGMVVAMGPRGYKLVLSVHVIHQNKIDEEGMQRDYIDEVREQTIQFWKSCRAQYGHNIAVVAGIDANVTLPRDEEGCTGSAVLALLKSHTRAIQYKILTWMRVLGLRALNTYGECIGASDLWT